MENLYGNPQTALLDVGGTKQGYGLPLVPTVNAEIALIDCDDHMTGVQFAHSDETKIGKIWFAIRMALSECSKLRDVFRTVELQTQ